MQGQAEVLQAGQAPIHIFANESVLMRQGGKLQALRNGVILEIINGKGPIKLHGGKRQGDSLLAVPDSLQRALRAVDFIPDEELTLRGDEVIEFTYRISGNPEWFGWYVKVAQPHAGSPDHSVSWPVTPVNGWQSKQFSIAEFASAANPDTSDSLWPGAVLDWFRLQCGSENGGKLNYARCV